MQNNKYWQLTSMHTILGKLPKKLAIAFSGGADSVFALDFLSRTRDITLVTYLHSESDFALEEEHMARLSSEKYNIPLIIGVQKKNKPKKCSKEAFWREGRYEFFKSIDMPIITAHNLDDNVESWIMGSLHGQPKLIPYKNDNVIRPFMLVKKSKIIDTLQNRNLNYLTDPDNTNSVNQRANIRNNIMPYALEVNPGLYKVIAKKVLEKFNNEYTHTME